MAARKKVGGGEVRVVLPRLHPGQQRVAAATERHRVVMCGRQWGKTTYGVRDAMDGLLAGQPVGWFAPNYKILTEAWREFVQRLAPITTRLNEQDKRLELATGGVLECWSCDGPDPGRSRKYARVYIDEAGLIPDLLDIWEQAIRATLLFYRGRAVFLGTPKGRRHGFMTLFQRGEAGDPEWGSFRAPTVDNPYIPPEEISAARKELPADVFRQEFEGVPTDDGANPFGLDAIAACVRAPDDGTVPNPVVVYGLDLGRSVDWTVLVGLDAWRRVVSLERWQLPWATTKTQVEAKVGKISVVADATGVGDAIVADLQLAGLAVTAHVFTQASKLRLMQRLVTAFQGRELALSPAEDARWLVSELKTFEFTYTNTGIRYEAPRGLHDDGVMALALALYGWDRVQGVAPEQAQPLPLRPDDGNVSREIAFAMAAGGLSQLPGQGW